MSLKFNPFTGNFDFVGTSTATGSDNFSYDYVPSGQTVTIPDGQQMLVDGPVRVLGHLQVNGILVDLSNRKPESFFYDVIEVGQVVEVYSDRLLLYKDHLTVLGHLRVNGRLAGV